MGCWEYAVSIGGTGTTPASRVQKYDVDTFSFEVDDAGESQHRLQNRRRGPWFVKFGERSVKASTTRDFTDRAEYDQFKKLTRTGFEAEMSYGEAAALRSLNLTMGGAIVDSFSVDSAGGQGAIVTGNVDYMGIQPSTTNPVYTAEVITDQDIQSNGTGDGLVLGQATETAPSFTIGITRSGTVPVLTGIDAAVIRHRPVGGGALDWRVKEAPAGAITFTADEMPSGPTEYQIAARKGRYVGAFSAEVEVTIS